MASPISSTTPAEVSRFGQRSELVMAVALFGMLGILLVRCRGRSSICCWH